MIKFLKYIVGYGICLSVVVGIIHIDRTTDRFDRVRGMLGIHASKRTAILGAPSIPTVAFAVARGDLRPDEASDVLFGLRRWPDYRPALPDARDGWDREMPFRMDDRDVVEWQVQLADELVASMGLNSGAMGSFSAGDEFAEMQALVGGALDGMGQAIGDTVAASITGPVEAGGAAAFKASGAVYRKEGREVLVAINKTWRSSFDGVNDMARHLDAIASANATIISINGYPFRVLQVGQYSELEHNVDFRARVLLSGLVPPEDLIQLALDIDLDAIHAFHGSEASLPTVASRLPQLN